MLSFLSLAEKKKISLKFDYKNRTLFGYIDHDKMEKIVFNLLSNAFKFTPEGGVVEVGMSLRGMEMTKQSHENDSSHKGLLRPMNLVRNDSKGFIQITISNTGVIRNYHIITNIYLDSPIRI